MTPEVLTTLPGGWASSGHSELLCKEVSQEEFGGFFCLFFPFPDVVFFSF